MYKIIVKVVFDESCQHMAGICFQFFMQHGRFAEMFHVAWKFCKNFQCKMSEFSMFFLKKKLAAYMYSFCMFCLHISTASFRLSF